MKRISLLSSLVVLLSGSLNASLDLTPVPREYTSQGFNYVQLSFKDDAGRIVYNPPLNWTYKGSGPRCQLTPPNKSLATVVIEAASSPQPLTPELRQAMEKQVMTDVPPGSQAVELLNQGENTVSIDGRDSFEVVLSYKALGESFRRSIVFLQVGDMRLTFRVTARAADFEAIKTAFHASLGSWHWEAPSARPPATPAG